MSAKQLSTNFSIVTRSKGHSAVDKASYISRSVLVSEYDGQTYRPKYHEDLVHSEISLPPNAPKEFSDRAALWNAVELSEKGQTAQLARMLKASLPNSWSYELAEEVVRDYVQRNFVSKGMCVDWAIHDSENEKGQRNLHFHLLATLRPLDENGKWAAKQRKVYDLDENGERIPVIDKKTGQQKVDKRNRKQWKCHTEQTTDWNSRANAKMWREDLTATINAVNERIGIEEQWEHRSFKEQGIDREPTIHLGAAANALERKGIRTERGDINREIRERNSRFEQAKEELEAAKQEVRSAQYARIRNAIANAKNEVLEMLERVQEKMGRLALPIVSAKYLAKIPNRDRVQDIDNAKSFLERNSITTFAQLEKYKTEKGREFDRQEQIFIPRWRRLEQLKALAKAYSDYEPYKAVYDMSKSLSGLKKMRYAKEHEHELAMYENTRADLKMLLSEGERITPKAWRTERERLEKEMPTLRNERARACHDLAFAEVISYNKANLERVEQNEGRQQAVSRTKRREEEI